MALDLVKGFSTKSFVSKRLWRTIKGLKEIGPKLGLNPDIHPDDPHSSAALAMAGLAGHEISTMGGNPYADPNSNGFEKGVVASRNVTGTGNSPMNGYQMSHEMTNLFEAALGSVGMNGQGAPNNGPGNGYVQIQDGDALAGIGSNVFGGDEELYRQLRDLF